MLARVLHELVEAKQLASFPDEGVRLNQMPACVRPP